MGDGIWRHMAIVFCDHIIRLDRYTGVKIEYNQSGYTNSETSPSTPRPETRLQSASLPHRQLPGAGVAKRNGNTHKRLQITRRAPLNFRKAQANGEGSSDDLFVGQNLEIRYHAVDC